jgi:small subunit ribosomal protein S6
MKLRHYETFYLLHPELSDEERAAISERFQQIIENGHGKIIKVDPWPLQKLAYEVQKQHQGYFLVMEYGAPAACISDLTHRLRLDEKVMKFVTTKISDNFDSEVLLKAKQESVLPTESDDNTSDSTQPDEEREE